MAMFAELEIFAELELIDLLPGAVLRHSLAVCRSGWLGRTSRALGIDGDGVSGFE